jgi:hypothetical protein
MAIICDVCGEDVTPNDECEFNDYEIVNINGKICLCLDCYNALSEFMLSEEFKKFSAKRKAEIGR